MKSHIVSSRKIAVTAMLSALSFVFQFFEFGLPFVPSFLKFDFSDLPALIGAFTFGPLAGISIELVKNILHCAVSQSATIGELSNFLLGAFFTGTAGLIYSHKKTKTTALIGGLTGTLVMALSSIPINYFIVYPFYYNFMPEETVLNAYQLILPKMENIFQCLLVFNLPFTAVKGILVLIITMLIYKKISPLLKGKICK